MTAHAAVIREALQPVYADTVIDFTAALAALAALEQERDEAILKNLKWRTEARDAQEAYRVGRQELVAAEAELADARLVVDDLIEMKANETGELEAEVDRLRRCLEREEKMGSESVSQARRLTKALDALQHVIDGSSTVIAKEAAEAERDAALRLVNGYRQADKTIARAEAAEADAKAWKDSCKEAEAELQQTGEYLRTITQRAVAAEAKRDKLREALREIHHLVQTRRTSIHMDGTEMFAQPLLAQINSIARAALAEDTP